ncbi:MAG: type II toxin-antitoxin system HicB family antitoxin [Deltaproteobacteria bacterium]|nr:type II toxin-antitoxin system HicB family antitoxin [Deltaproteobacteria bacterium]
MCFAPGGALLSQLTIEFWMDDGWYVGRLKEFPVVMSQGQTLDELKENIRDAYALVIADASSAADVPA